MELTGNTDRIILSLAIILAGLVIIWFIVHKVRQEVKRIPGIIRANHIIRKAVIPIAFLIAIIALKLNISLILTEEEYIKITQDVLTVFTIASVAWISINFIRITRFVLLQRYDISQKDNLKARKVYTQFRLLERILVFIIIFIAITIALMSFDSIKRVGVSLFASAGVAGIIIGLAAQRAIGSILAGFQIAITQPIRLEDVVIVEGEWGWIEEITLTYVVIRIWDKRRLVVPTTYFIEKPFENWTRNASDILGTVYIYSDYTLPVDDLRKEFKRLLDTTELWDGNVAVIQVTDATEKTLEIRALMSAADSPTAWDLRVLIREKLIDFMQQKHPEKLPKTRIFIPEDK